MMNNESPQPPGASERGHTGLEARDLFRSCETRGLVRAGRVSGHTDGTDSPQKTPKSRPPQPEEMLRILRYRLHFNPEGAS